MTKRTVTHGELLDLLCQRKGSMIVTATTRTDARLRKTGNPHPKAVKVNRLQLLVNFDYEAGVNRRLEKEGKEATFEAGSNWHVPVTWRDGSMTPFCKHKTTGQLYLRAQCLRQLDGPHYIAEDGKTLAQADVEPYLPKKAESNNQDLDNPLVFRVYGLSSLKELTFDGEEYEVSDGE